MCKKVMLVYAEVDRCLDAGMAIETIPCAVYRTTRFQLTKEFVHAYRNNRRRALAEGGKEGGNAAA